LTTLINSISTSYKILNPHNYISLPGNSTNTPIHILNNIIEDSYCNKKELWLLSQDMSKAYDSVNLDLLKLALKHIQIPFQLNNIITNLLTNKTNRVITNIRLTEPYNVNNGIDQREII